MLTEKLTSFRWPAEWELHESTWLAWPVNSNTWPGIFDRIPSAFARFVAAITRFEPVDLLFEGKSSSVLKHLDTACEAAGSIHPVRIHDIPVNDSWCRDYGPIFLNRRSVVSHDDTPTQLILNWDYNAWGGKYPPWDFDSRVASRIGEHLGVPVIFPGWVLEGGAIEGNGAGALMTTESCLLNPNRNSDLNREQIEAVLRQFLNAETIIWLPGEGILGDDTDGHIDQVARFTSERSVLVAAPYSPDAPEAAELRRNFQAVAESRNSAGQPVLPSELRMPTPKFQQGHRLPACYCNFYITNGAVIVPTFEDVADDEAMQVLQDHFPQREIVGVNAIDLIWGLGAFHCMTQQQPAFMKEFPE